MTFDRTLRAAAAAAAVAFGMALPTAATSANFLLSGEIVDLMGDREPASGFLSFDTDDILVVDTGGGVFSRTLTLADIALSLTAFGESFTEANVLAEPGDEVVELGEDGVPFTLALDFDLGMGVMFSLFDVEHDGQGGLTFTGSVDILSPDGGAGTGSPGSGGADGVIPLPATLPLLLGALGVGGLVLRRRPV